MNEKDRLDSRLNGLETALKSVGVDLSYKNLLFVVEEYDAGVGMESEMESYAHVGGVDYQAEYEKQKRLNKDLSCKLKRAEKERDIYCNNVSGRYNTDVEIGCNNEIVDARLAH